MVYVCTQITVTKQWLIIHLIFFSVRTICKDKKAFLCFKNDYNNRDSNYFDHAWAKYQTFVLFSAEYH